MGFFGNLFGGEKPAGPEQQQPAKHPWDELEPKSVEELHEKNFKAMSAADPAPADKQVAEKFGYTQPASTGPEGPTDGGTPMPAPEQTPAVPETTDDQQAA